MRICTVRSSAGRGITARLQIDAVVVQGDSTVPVIRALCPLVAPSKENATLGIDRRREERENEMITMVEISIRGLRDRVVHDSKDQNRAERFDCLVWPEIRGGRQ